MKNLKLILVSILMILMASCSSDNNSALDYVPEDAQLCIQLNTAKIVELVGKAKSGQIPILKKVELNYLDSIKTSGIDLSQNTYIFYSKSFGFGLLGVVENPDSLKINFEKEYKQKIQTAGDYNYFLSGDLCGIFNNEIVFVGTFQKDIAENQRLNLAKEIIQKKKNFIENKPKVKEAFEDADDMIVYINPQIVNDIPRNLYSGDTMIFSMIASQVESLIGKVSIEEKKISVNWNINYIKDSIVPKIFSDVVGKPSPSFLDYYPTNIQNIGAISLNGKELSVQLEKFGIYSMMSMQGIKEIDNLKQLLSVIDGPFTMGVDNKATTFISTMKVDDAKNGIATLEKILNNEGISLREKGNNDYEISFMFMSFYLKVKDKNIIMGTTYNGEIGLNSYKKFFEKTPIGFVYPMEDGVVGYMSIPKADTINFELVAE